MFKRSLLFALLVFPLISFCQLRQNGSVVTSFPVLKDIKGNVYDVKSILDSGKHVVFFWFVANQAASGWSFNNSGVLQQYYSDYGPSGTMNDDARVFMLEFDYSTDSNDIKGVGTNSVGDWTAGNNFPIVDVDSDPNAMLPFVNPPSPGNPAGAILPAIFVVCADKKMYELGQLPSSALMRSSIVNSCGIVSGINSITNKDIFSVTPNPANTYLEINLSNKNLFGAKYSIVDFTGRLKQQGEILDTQGSLKIATSTWAAGIYFIALTSDRNTYSRRVIVSH